MSVGDLLFATSEAGLALKVSMSEDTLRVYPAANITPELATDITRYKAEIVRILREDEEMQRTGIIQSERQVFELAHEYFGSTGKSGEE